MKILKKILSKTKKVLATLGGFPIERVKELIKTVGLEGRGHSKYKTYSLGMKQRLGIAAALLPNPKLLVLDEPTNGLDPEGIQEVRDLLKKLAQNGTTVFVSSHLLSELESQSSGFQKCCDSKFWMNGEVFAGPATYGLKHYQVTRSGNLLNIKN